MKIAFFGKILATDYTDFKRRLSRLLRITGGGRQKLFFAGLVFLVNSTLKASFRHRGHREHREI
jgi:hypothetical protein